MNCPSCGQVHDHELTAGLAFVKIARLIATTDHMIICPQVMLHVVGLLGAMLIEHSGYNYTDVMGEVARVLENPAGLKRLHQGLIDAGLVDPVAGLSEEMH